MSKTTYKAAKIASPLIASHFEMLIKQAMGKAEIDLARAPSEDVIEELINVAFWASLRKEEGNSPKISIAFLSPEQAENPLILEVKLPLTAAVLTKLAPGVERAGIHIGVWEENGLLYIWGTATKIPNYCFILDVSDPGLLVIKHRRLQGFGKYTNVAVMKGDEIKVVDKGCGCGVDRPAIVTALLDIDAPCTFNDNINVAIQLAVVMRNHHRGGILLIVPPDSTDWKRSLVHPLQYPVSPSFSNLSNLLHTNHQEHGKLRWLAALKDEVENIGGLTAIDGATVISRDHELHTFGAKIVRRTESNMVEQVLYVEPVINGEAERKFMGQVGGTRHLSAAQFIYDQRDSLALVASQDGYFTVFSWSATEEIVQAYRIDTLLV